MTSPKRIGLYSAGAVVAFGAAFTLTWGWLVYGERYAESRQVDEERESVPQSEMSYMTVAAWESGVDFLQDPTFWRFATPHEISRAIFHGADVQIRNAVGSTPLHHAAEFSNSLPVIEKMLEAGADPTARNKYLETPFHRAIRGSESVEIVRFLDNVSTLKILKPERRLVLAARHNRTPEVVQYFVDAADINQGIKTYPWSESHTVGEQALLNALRNNSNPEVLRVLLEAGVDIKSVVDVWPLEHVAASINPNFSMLKYFLEAGADPCRMRNPARARETFVREMEKFGEANAGVPKVLFNVVRTGDDSAAPPKIEEYMKENPMNLVASVLENLVLSYNPDAISYVEEAVASCTEEVRQRRYPIPDHLLFAAFLKHIRQEVPDVEIR